MSVEELMQHKQNPQPVSHHRQGVGGQSEKLLRFIYSLLSPIGRSGKERCEENFYNIRALEAANIVGKFDFYIRVDSFMEL